MATNNIEVVINAKDYATKVLQWINKQVSWVAKEVWNVMVWLLKTTALAWAWVIWFWIKSASSLEQTNIAFKNLYWNAEQAWKTIKDLVQFANTTPFEMPEIADMWLKLKNVAWIADKDLIPTLTRLWDIASSQWKSISQITEAYLDAITGENERLKEFWITAKVHGDMVDYTFRWVTTTVAKTKEWIGGYLEKIGEMQGIQGGMLTQSNTLNGLFSTFKDTVSWLTRNLVWLSDTGEIVKGWLLDKLKTWLQEMTTWINENKDTIQKWGQFIQDTFTFAIDFVLNTINLLTTWWTWEFQSFFTQITTIVQQWLQILTDFWTKYWADITLIITTLVNAITWAISGFFNNIMPVIESWLKIIWETFSFFSNLLQWNWSEAWGNIKNIVWDWLWLIKNLIKLALDTILWFFWTSLEWIRLKVSWWIDNLKTIISQGWQWIKDSISWVVWWIKTTVESVFTSVSEFIMWKIQWLKTFLDEVVAWIQKAKQSISNLPSSISQAVKNAPANIKTIVWEISWARADWWPVSSWKTYLVWERWPELFTPKWNWNIIPNNQLWWGVNITINMWWVVANNNTDVNSIADMISQKLTRQLSLYKMWVA